MDKAPKHLLLFLLLAGAPAVLGLDYVYRHLEITTSKSLPHRFFWKVNEQPGPGDFALFELTHPLAGPHPVRITKQLKCWAGEELTVLDQNYFCNGEFLGLAKEKGLHGQELPHFTFSGPVPDGFAFAYGADPDSFDSRYWGFVRVAETQRLVPIF